MQRSDDRILTTHAGSLPRPPDLTRMMWDLLEQKPVDEVQLQARVKQAVAEVVARQCSAGVDIVSDGEMSKVGFSNYVMRRYSGFANRAQFVATDLGDFPDIVNKLFVENEGGQHLVLPNVEGPIELRDRDAVQRFNPQIMYLAIGTPFPGFKTKFGNKVNGILMYGGLDPGAPGLDEYYKAHRAMFNRESEAGAVSVYACLEVTQQAIETVGEIDRTKIRDAIANGTFQTIWGEIKYRNQLNADPWAVAQWQNGEVVGLYPASKRGARPVQFPKPAWT